MSKVRVSRDHTSEIHDRLGNARRITVVELLHGPKGGPPMHGSRQISQEYSMKIPCSVVVFVEDKKALKVFHRPRKWVKKLIESDEALLYILALKAGLIEQFEL